MSFFNAYFCQPSSGPLPTSCVSLSPWTTRRSNKSILKEIKPEDSLEGLMLKLMLRYFDYLIQRVDSLEKTLMLGGQEEKGITEDEMFGWHH